MYGTEEKNAWRKVNGLRAKVSLLCGKCRLVK